MRALILAALLSSFPLQPPLAAPTALPPLRLYHCHRATTAIVIDGRLNDPAWRAAEIATRFTDLFQKQRPVTQQTRVRLLWDEEYLYAAFSAVDNNAWATKMERDAPLWEEEVVELYLDPDGDARDYLEYEVNPLGALIDLLIPYAGAQAEWQKCARWNCAGIQAAARVFGQVADRTQRDHGWAAELAVPLSALPPQQGVPPRPGVVWRAQFFRIDRPVGEPDPRCSSWNDTPLFHLPERFGQVVFTGPQALP